MKAKGQDKGDCEAPPTGRPRAGKASIILLAVGLVATSGSGCDVITMSQRSELPDLSGKSLGEWSLSSGDADAVQSAYYATGDYKVTVGGRVFEVRRAAVTVAGGCARQVTVLADGRVRDELLACGAPIVVETASE